MKLKEIAANNKKRVFELTLQNKKEYTFPYLKLEVKPTSKNKIVDLYVDKEIGNLGFTYVLENEKQDTILVDQVLSFCQDPDHQLEQVLYNLTTELQAALTKSTLSKRQLAKLLGTSPSQLERLLDQKNYKKSANALIKALGFLSKTVEITAA